MKVDKIYMIKVRDYYDNGEYEEEIIGVTEDLNLANELALKEEKHQIDVYGLKEVDVVTKSSGGVAYRLKSAKGSRTSVYVCRTNLFTKE